MALMIAMFQRGIFQSAPLSRGETVGLWAGHFGGRISIRSPLTRGDTVSCSIREIKRHFNPLPSYEGRRVTPNSANRL